MLLPEALTVTAACCSALSSMFLSELKGRVPPPGHADGKHDAAKHQENAQRLPEIDRFAGNVGIISTLSSVTPIIILPLVWLRSGQRPTNAAWAGALLAIVGTALISLR